MAHIIQHQLSLSKHQSYQSWLGGLWVSKRLKASSSHQQGADQWADGQANLNCSHMTFCTLCCAPAHSSHSMIKPTKSPVRPAKTRISLGIHPVWSEPSLSTWRNNGFLATHKAHREDLSLYWSHKSFCLVLSCAGSNLRENYLSDCGIKIQYKACWNAAFPTHTGPACICC